MIIEQRISHKPQGESTQEEAVSRETDECLALSVCGGSRNALEELYDRHVQQCFGVSLRIMRSSNTAEDVVHDVFTRFSINPQIYSPHRGLFSAWLISAVHRQSVQALRQARTQTGAEPQASAQLFAQETLWDHLQHGTTSSSVQLEDTRSELQPLSARQRQTLAFIFFEGLTFEETAVRLNESPDQVAQEVRLAMRRLAEAVRS